MTTTKVSENRKLNRVRTPKLRWFNCYNDVKCASHRDVTCPAETDMFPVVEPEPTEPAETTAPVSDVMLSAQTPLRAVPGKGSFPAPKVWR